MATTGSVDSFKLEDSAAILANFIARIDGAYTLRATYTDSESNPRYVYFVWTHA